ncbi:hypothetical protein OG311_07550 [Streptomyces sp. NBC_01343]|uniref:hypothetical protein n=1 Tax=Streptomyces sp. NBC_01343 TaxID=2903832 RepID=UPI002E0FB0DD|nr:hypothetical protein OG311_07550 [Streptomyces sp. NBC_01343]
MGVDRIDGRVYHSRSWGLAKDLRGFLLHNGGEEVVRSAARPGDVIFHEQVAADPAEPRDWVDRQQAACRHMPVPTMEPVFAWAGPVLGLSALVVCLLLARWIRRRCGVRLWDTWPGLLAFVFAMLNVLAIAPELFMPWATCTPDGSGSILGDCG